MLGAKAVDNPSPVDTPEDIDFPIGFFEYKIRLIKHGEESFVVIFLPEGVVINSFYKFGPTPDDPTPHWYDFSFDGVTGAQFLIDRVVLRFVDGLRGDDDITENGMIVEPGGPGFIEILEESIDDTDGCSLASSDSQVSSNSILNLFILLIPSLIGLFSMFRRKMEKSV